MAPPDRRLELAGDSFGWLVDTISTLCRFSSLPTQISPPTLNGMANG